MDILNSIKKSFVDVGKDISQMASETGEMAKTAGRIRELEKEYNDVVKEIGLKFLDDPKAMEVCPGLVDVAKKNREEYEVLRKEQIALRGNKICPSCGAEQPKDAAHCGTCGADISAVVPDRPKSRGPVCPTCGKDIVAGTKFCPGCGTKVSEATE